MKNYTPARQELKKRGWIREDRSVDGLNYEYWRAPGLNSFGFPHNLVTFESACRKEDIKITKEDKQ